MTDIQRNLFIGIGIVVLAGAGIYFLAYKTAAGPASPMASTTAVTLDDGTVVTIPAGATLTEIPETPAASAPVAPDYRAPVVYETSVSAEVRAAVEAQVTEMKKLLAQNPQDFSAWMNLAILHKIGGDYRGAEAIWLYATKVWPTSPVAYNNLADLYTNFLKDPAKAKFYSGQAAKLQ